VKTPLTVLLSFHLLGNALLLWLGYTWLGIPESNTAHLLLSVAALLVFICATLWLHGTAFVYFSRETGRGLRQATVAALRHLPALAALAGLAVLLYAALMWANGMLDAPAFRVASWLTLTIRKPVPPARVLLIFQALVWLLRWLLLPALLIPPAAAISANGFAGFKRFARRWELLRSLKVFALVLGAVWVPLKLLAWVPKMPNFSAEMASLLVRAAAAYLLSAGLLLVLERIASAGSPSLSHRSSSAVP
jgi:hypothetical protein